MSKLNATGLSEDCERKYGGMELSDAKKLKALEDENNRLKSWRDQKTVWGTVFPEQRLLT